MTRHFTLLGLFIVLYGCGAQVPSEALGDDMLLSGCVQFGTGRLDGQPGIDFGSIYYFDKRFIVWSDGAGCAIKIGRGTDQGVLHAREPQTGECEYKYPRSGRGTATVAGQTFQMANGNMFLVSFRDPKVRVRQLRRDLSTIEITHNGENGLALKRLMRYDRDFQDFFGKPTFSPNHGT